MHTHIHTQKYVNVQTCIAVNMHIKWVCCAGGVWYVVCACIQLNIIQNTNETHAYLRKEGIGEKGRKK